MESFLSIQWDKMLFFSISPLEIIIRGSVMYVSIYVMLRLILKRQMGSLDIPDVLIMVLVADAASNGMSGEYTSLLDGILLVAVILTWSFVLDWLTYHSRTARRFINPPPLPLVQDGRIVEKNVRRELISTEELMSHLREQGITDVNEVKSAQLESDGRISVVKKQ